MLYQLKRTQLVNTDLETCWNFFMNPANLAHITPDYMNFRVLTEQPERSYEGLIIHYRMNPVLKIPIRWTTEITHIRENSYFVDEQRKGPYRMWHHEHRFEETASGVLMTDLVSYIVPFGILGRFANWLFVRRQLETIFNYREKVIDQRFPH